MKNIFYYNKGFTLIELLVIISLISILSLGVSNISFRKNIDRDNLDSYINNIYNTIETIRNNSLLGKGIGINLKTPDQYKININKSNSGTIKTYYLSGGTFKLIDTLNAVKYGSINDIECSDIDGQNKDDTIDNVDLIYKGETLTLSGCANTNRIIGLGIKYKGSEKGIVINSVSGLIHKTGLK